MIWRRFTTCLSNVRCIIFNRVTRFCRKVLSRDDQSFDGFDLQLEIIPRQDHGISRKYICDNALKVLYRLNKAGFEAYLVGGGVRDLLSAKSRKISTLQPMQPPNKSVAYLETAALSVVDSVSHILFLVTTSLKSRRFVVITTNRKPKNFQANPVMACFFAITFMAALTKMQNAAISPLMPCITAFLISAFVIMRAALMI